MKFSNYNFIKQWEGLRLEAYRNRGDVWTIGYGHTKTASPGKKITVEEANRLLEEDLEWAVNAVNEGVTRPINQNQFDAFVSLCYNIGATAFLRSTALRKFNSGFSLEAAEALTWWNKVGKKVVKGLVNRREAERKLFLTPVDNKEVKLAELELEFIQTIDVLVDSFVRRFKEIINV